MKTSTILMTIVLMFLTACGNDHIAPPVPSANGSQAKGVIPVTEETAKEHFQSFHSPPPLSWESIMQDEETVVQVFETMEEWVETVIGNGSWYVIEDSVYPLMLEELQKHFSEPVATRIVDQFYKKENGYFSLKEQEKFKKLSYLEQLNVQIQTAEDTVKVTFNGRTDQGEYTVMYSLVPDKTDGYLMITDYTLSIDPSR